MSERTTDPLEILDAIDRERGESFIGMIQANQVRQLRDEIVALREIAARPSPELHALIKERDELRAQLGSVRGIAGNERKLSEAMIQQARAEALEEAARLHENINAACDHERQHGAPGAGAMGAVIEYRDAIRALKEKER